jgi:hypothetical protein
MLVAEFGFVLGLRGLSIREYLGTRDIASGTVYYVMLAVFAIMALLVALRCTSRDFSLYDIKGVTATKALSMLSIAQ